MNRSGLGEPVNRKVILIVIGALFVFVICSGVGIIMLIARAQQVVANTASNNPETVSEVAEYIVDYQLPPDYTQSLTMSLDGITMAGFTTQDEHNAILLFQIPSKYPISTDEIRQQMNELAEKQTGEGYSLEQTDTQQVMIRGQAVEMDIYEGTSSSGKAYRQMMGSFNGKKGTTWLMIISPTNSWDQPSLDAFIASIR
jgi:hypothetical protein